MTTISYNTNTQHREKTAINKQHQNNYNDLVYPAPMVSNKNINSDRSKRKSSLTSIENDKWCCFSAYKRQQFCLNLLYYDTYSYIYIIIILITIAAFIWDLWDLRIDNLTLRQQPLWFISLNMICLFLMVLDIIIHIQAFKSIFFKSLVNWVDFLFVVIVAAITPIWFYYPAWILLFLLFLRFTVRLLRRHTFRKQYVSARNVIVDFSAYESNEDEQRKYTDFANPTV
eukprot:480199_1